MEAAVNRHESPSLERRIVAALGNANASGAELSELVAEIEQAVAAADQTVASEREQAADLVSTPSAEAAQQAMSRAEVAAFTRDRLRGVLPKLRERYTAALVIERRDRWTNDCKKVEAEQEALRQEYKGIDQAYRSAKSERDKLIRRMEDCDLDCERVNAAARELNIWDRQLEPMLEPMQPERKWGTPKIANGNLAAVMAQSMVPSAYDPARWSDPEVRAQRRAEIMKEQQRIGEHYARMTEEQEQRQNAEERQRFGFRS
jgi:hypothetical protein